MTHDEALEKTQSSRLLEASQNRSDDRPTHKFTLSIADHDTFTSRVAEKRRTRNYNEVKNSMLKKKGSWSYDWRIPLLELKENFQKDFAPLLDLGEFVRPDTLYSQFATEEIFPPDEWSSQSFASYINDLAQSKVSRLMDKDLYRGSTNHVLDVKEALLALFNSKSLSEYHTTNAFENALRFFYRHSMIGDAKTLFNIMQERSIPITSRTFNIALRAAAEQKDLHNFTYLLRSMISRDTMPNENTWVSLVIALESVTAKIAVVQNMSHLGLLERTDIAQAIAADLLPIELSKLAESRIDASNILEKFDSQFGKSWFSISAGNIIVQHLCEAGQADGALEFLESMVERQSTPNKGTLDVLLSHCLMNLDAEGALQLLRLFYERFNVVGGQTTYHILFLLAWHTHRYNTCRVVWWKACIEAAVSYRMQELMMRSLFRNTPSLTSNQSKLWMKEAGKVIANIGVSDQSEHEPDAGENSDRPINKIAEQLAEYRPQDQGREDQVELARRTLTADMSAFKQYRLDTALFHLSFAQALKLDIQLHKKGLSKISLAEKIRLAVHIPIRYKIRMVDDRESAGTQEGGEYTSSSNGDVYQDLETEDVVVRRVKGRSKKPVL